MTHAYRVPDCAGVVCDDAAKARSTETCRLTPLNPPLVRGEERLSTLVAGGESANLGKREGHQPIFLKTALLHNKTARIVRST